MRCVCVDESEAMVRESLMTDSRTHEIRGMNAIYTFLQRHERLGNYRKVDDGCKASTES